MRGRILIVSIKISEHIKVLYLYYSVLIILIALLHNFVKVNKRIKSLQIDTIPVAGKPFIQGVVRPPIVAVDRLKIKQKQ